MITKAKLVAVAALSLFATTLGARAGCLDDVRKAGVLRAGNGVMGTKPTVW